MSDRARPLLAGLAGAAATIALVTVASRLVGFGRWLAQASAVGPTALGDSYNAANTLPNVLFEVAAGGALAGVVVPLLTGPLARGLRADVDRIASALLGWTLVVLVPLAGLVAVFARPLVVLFLRDGTEAELDVAASFLAVFAPQIPLYGLGVVLTGVLQAHHRFLWPALAPLLSSLVVVAVYLTFGALTEVGADPSGLPAAALAWLAWGTTAGVAAMSLPLLWPVHRTGLRLRPTLRFPEGVAARARPLALAGLGALLAQQASVLVTLALATDHGPDGTYPVFLYSQAVYLLPYAVLAVPLATATFPRLAERASQGDSEGFARLTSTTTRAVLLVSAAGAAALMAGAPAVERAFGAFADGDFSGMATALTWMAPGLLGFALVFHLARALYALDRGRAAVTATVAGWLMVIVTALVAVPVLTGGEDDRVATLQGLAVASSLGMTVAGVLLVRAIVRAAGPAAGAGLGRTALVLFVAGAAGATAGRWAGDAVLGPVGDGLGGVVVAGTVGGLTAGALVAVLAWLADRSTVRTLVVRRSGAEPMSTVATTGEAHEDDHG